MGAVILVPRLAVGKKPPLTKATARDPPSHPEYLPPRRGKFDADDWPVLIGPPLSLEKMKSVFSHIPFFFKAWVTFLTISSMTLDIAYSPTRAPSNFGLASPLYMSWKRFGDWTG